MDLTRMRKFLRTVKTNWYPLDLKEEIMAFNFYCDSIHDPFATYQVVPMARVLEGGF